MMYRYGKILNGKQSVEFTLADMYLFYSQVLEDECPDGYKPVEPVIPYPTPAKGEKLAFRVTDTGDSITKEAFVVDEVKSYAPRKFSKLKLYGAIAQIGAWDAIKAWLEQKTVNGINGWMAFQLAQEIAEDHPLFESMAEEARLLIGLTKEQFEQILGNCALED